MARETRGSASAATSASTPAAESSNKRKRQDPSETQSATIKIVLPSASSLQDASSASTSASAAATALPKVKLNISPAKANGTGNGGGSGASSDSPEKDDAKRQKISLKINGVKAVDAEVEKTAVASNEGADGADAAGTVTEPEVIERTGDKEAPETKTGQALSSEVREGLAVVISRMSANLPRPLNTTLELYLPPSFDQVKSNTLGFRLQQPGLTWEDLAATLHTFVTHLLQPCAYPSPFPPAAQLRLPIPPLLPHQPPHPIYNFCVGLRDIMLALDPGVGVSNAQEKWALVQSSLPAVDGKGGGDWWTSLADGREYSKLKGIDKGESAMAQLAADGNKFGYASAVSITSVAKGEAGPRLGDSLIRKASLKAQRWKEQLAKKQGGFGDVHKPVSIPSTSSLPWTPAFAPTFDSTMSSGGIGYWDTLDAMHQRNRTALWRKSLSTRPKAEEGYWGSIDAEDSTAESPSELDTNAEHLNELLAWQEVRVKRGEIEVGKRELQVAEEVLASLTRLSSSLKPSDLTKLEPGDAHDISKRLIPTPAPSLRGTLDPRRPKAMHDNVTIKSRPPAPAVPSNTPSIAQQLAGTPTRSGFTSQQPPIGQAQAQQHQRYGTPGSLPGQNRPGYNYTPSIPASGQSAGAAGGYRPSAPAGYGYSNSPYPNPQYNAAPGSTMYSNRSPINPSAQGQLPGTPSPNYPANQLPGYQHSAAGYGGYQPQGRPGPAPMPSGLRQSYTHSQTPMQHQGQQPATLAAASIQGQAPGQAQFRQVAVPGQQSVQYNPTMTRIG